MQNDAKAPEAAHNAIMMGLDCLVNLPQLCGDSLSTDWPEEIPAYQYCKAVDLCQQEYGASNHKSDQ